MYLSHEVFKLFKTKVIETKPNKNFTNIAENYNRIYTEAFSEYDYELRRKRFFNSKINFDEKFLLLETTELDNNIYDYKNNYLKKQLDTLLPGISKLINSIMLPKEDDLDNPFGDTLKKFTFQYDKNFLLKSQKKNNILSCIKVPSDPKYTYTLTYEFDKLSLTTRLIDIDKFVRDAISVSFDYESRYFKYFSIIKALSSYQNNKEPSGETYYEYFVIHGAKNNPDIKVNWINLMRDDAKEVLTEITMSIVWDVIKHTAEKNLVKILKKYNYLYNKNKINVSDFTLSGIGINHHNLSILDDSPLVFTLSFKTNKESLWWNPRSVGEDSLSIPIDYDDIKD